MISSGVLLVLDTTPGRDGRGRRALLDGIRRGGLWWRGRRIGLRCELFELAVHVVGQPLGRRAVGADDARGEQPGPNAAGLAVLQSRRFERTPGETAGLRLRRVAATGEITEEGRKVLVVGPLGVPSWAAPR